MTISARFDTRMGKTSLFPRRYYLHMKTERMYLKDKYLSNLQTKISELKADPSFPDDLVVCLEKTIFFPGGGGQSCDLGTINGQPLVKVSEKDGEIFHQIQGGKAFMDDGSLSVGAEVNLELDWDRRFDNMQRHCGEHILSGVFYDLYGGVNRGFHMGDDYMTIDISLEDNPEYTTLTHEMAMEAELGANKIIWKDLPVTAHHFDTKSDASHIALRKELTVEEDITIVTIGDVTHPADSVACCGTHPSTSGQVGLLKIYKVEPNKGMFRVFFDAGARALDGYRRRFEILSSIEKDLSAGVPDILDKYQASKDRARDIRDRLFRLTKEVQERELLEIKRYMDENSSESPLFEYENLAVDDIIEIGRNLEGSIPNILFLIHKPSLTVLLFSDSQDCGKLVKDNVSVFSGKGGGNRTFARAIFTSEDNALMFIDAIRKLTR